MMQRIINYYILNCIYKKLMNEINSLINNNKYIYIIYDYNHILYIYIYYYLLDY